VADRVNPLPQLHRATEALLVELAAQATTPWQAWGPPLATVMGLRSGEIAMLTREDLTLQHGRWFLRIRRGPAGALKDHRNRMIPVPAALQAAGFVRFARRSETVALFPDLKRAPTPGQQLDAWVRLRAKRSGQPTLEGMGIAALRRACGRALTLYGDDATATEMFMGRKPSTFLAMRVRAAEDSRVSERLIALVDRTKFPTLVAMPYAEVLSTPGALVSDAVAAGCHFRASSPKRNGARRRRTDHVRRREGIGQTQQEHGVQPPVAAEQTSSKPVGWWRGLLLDWKRRRGKA
jgi:hypothetical protein